MLHLSSLFFYLLLFAWTGGIYGVELSAAPHGYSCNRNGWDAPQYCLCNKGERIVKFASVHNSRREDRQWDLGCKAIPWLTFSSDKWISITPGNGWDGAQEWNGVASNSFLVGFSSHHDNRREDRIYRFFTARSNSFALHHCSGWRTLNDYDRPINLQLGDEEVIAGVKSVHNNHHEDRRFSVITCKIAGTNGVFTSPNHPHHYPNNFEKTETIHVEQGKAISLKFSAFYVEYHSTCRWDHLTIVDGDGTTLLEKSCGDNHWGNVVIGGQKVSSLPDIRSRSNMIKLHFKTDRSVTKAGWSVRWNAWPSGCGRQERGYHSAGNNVPGYQGIPSAGPDDCASKCAHVSACAGWTLHTPSKKCWLKTKIAGKGNHGHWVRGACTGGNAVASTCKCGMEKHHRIVGGQQYTSGKYPWMLALWDSTDASNPKWAGCGGTLIASGWVVTAAHCIWYNKNGVKYKYTKDNLYVVLDTNTKEVRLQIDPIVHENYKSPKSHSNDIALLKLSEDVDLDIYTPACLPPSGADYTGQNGRVYGWGSVQSCPSRPAHVLMEVEISIISDMACRLESNPSVTYKDNNGRCVTGPASYWSAISDEMLCAGGQDPGKDSCQGDSGGPFTVKGRTTNKHELVGVVSWGSGCAADGMSGVYAEVAKLRGWIDKKIAAYGGATFCA